MKYKITIGLFTIIINAILFSCNDNPSGPADNAQPGRRDYTWEVDTLAGLHSARYRMWGSSPTDVWTTSDGDVNVSITHFNGMEWTSYRVPGLISPNGIYGFSPELVFVGGEYGKIWKYDGNNWEIFADLNNSGIGTFENIWGDSLDDMYAVGCGPDELLYCNRSIIASNVDGEWKLLDTHTLTGNVVHLYKNKSDNKIYFRLTKIGGAEGLDSTIIYEYRKPAYYRLYSSPEIKGSRADISIINDEVYFILGKQIFSRANDKFLSVLDISGYDFYGRIWGRNYKDIFILMTDGLAHYNGVNIEYLFHFTYPGTQIYGAAIFEEEVFFVAYEPSTGLSIVYHGILE